MIDAPGSWSTGPFTLIEGFSSLDNEQVIIREDPLACTWLPVREDRTPQLKLKANPNYWDKARGPRLAEIVFRNDLSYEHALASVCMTEGDVDIVTNVRVEDAARVEKSEHADLIAIDAMRAVVGIINRDATDFPLNDRRARQALNMCVDRQQIVEKGMFGRAAPLAGLTPPSAVTALHRLTPYAHDPQRAAELWREASGRVAPQSRPLRLTCANELETVARLVAVALVRTLGIEVKVIVCSDKEKLQLLRRLAEKKSPPDWDIFLYAWSGQTTDVPPLGLHRAFVGADGELRAGAIIPEFEARFAELKRETNVLKQARISYHIDEFVRDEALALFLCAPQALYAVNKHVSFTPYRTTFELAETEVSDKHWSRRRAR